MDEQELIELVKGALNNLFFRLSKQLDNVTTKEELKTFVGKLSSADFKGYIRNQFQVEKSDRTLRVQANQDRITTLDEADTQLDQLFS